MQRIANSEPCSKLTGVTVGHGRPASSDGRPTGIKEPDDQPNLTLLFELIVEELGLSILDTPVARLGRQSGSLNRGGPR